MSGARIVAPHSPISGSIGTWNRAETIVSAWNVAINVAASIVGPRRRRIVGVVTISPTAAKIVRPRCPAR